jgi:hypothetical protein
VIHNTGRIVQQYNNQMVQQSAAAAIMVMITTPHLQLPAQCAHAASSARMLLHFKCWPATDCPSKPHRARTSALGRGVSLKMHTCIAASAYHTAQQPADVGCNCCQQIQRWLQQHACSTPASQLYALLMLVVLAATSNCLEPAHVLERVLAECHMTSAAAAAVAAAAAAATITCL